MNATETRAYLAALYTLDPRHRPADEVSAEVQLANWEQILAEVDYHWALSWTRRLHSKTQQFPMQIGALTYAWGDEQDRRIRNNGGFPDGHCGIKGCRCTHTAPCDHGFIKTVDKVNAYGSYECVSRCYMCTPQAQSQ